MSLTFPRLPYTKPTAIACQPNGRLHLVTPDGGTRGSLLRDIGYGGKLEASRARRAWAALWIAAKAAGIPLTWTPGGTYRTLDNEIAAWHARMTTVVLNYPGMPAPRFYMGQWWYLRPGNASVATPGLSKHGDGCAVDIGYGLSPADTADQTADETNEVLRWLTAPADGYEGCNAVSLGWCWDYTDPNPNDETTIEAWHLNYFPGDQLPQRVVDIENMFGGPQP